MQQAWTERAIKGAKLLAIGGAMTLSHGAIAGFAFGHPLAEAAVSLVFGVAAPCVVVWGLYLLATRHKPASVPTRK